VADRMYAGNKSYYYVSIHSNTSSNESEGSGSTANGFEIFTSIGQTQSDLFAKIAAQVYQSRFPGRKFRGLKESDFYVLKQTDCPAFLVENMFYDNYEEAQFLVSEKGQQDIADCLFDVIKGIS
jgi:N-acetylmuramoyl-L-alanine amidase